MNAKPGVKSTEFWGKLLLQIILLVNCVLQIAGQPSIEISQELSVSIIASIEGLYLVWRQWSKNAALQADAAVQKAVIQANPILGTNQQPPKKT